MLGMDQVKRIRRKLVKGFVGDEDCVCLGISYPNCLVSLIHGMERKLEYLVNQVKLLQNTF